jgi:hypothetical protein
VKAAGVTLIAFLVFCGGCVTRPDWIQATLVTADVSGVWQGRPRGSGTALRRLATFELHQEGPKVTGTVSVSELPLSSGAGPLEGRVGGDVFHFTVRSVNGVWTGELTVVDDQMEGLLTASNGQTMSLLLRRISPASAPTSN